MYYQQERQLQNWFRKMVNMFPGLSFKYEYSDRRGVYLVSAIINTEDERYDDYCVESMCFEDKMNMQYIDSAPLFTENEELFHLSPDAIVVDEKYISKTFSVSKKNDEYVFSSTEEMPLKPEDDWQECKRDYPMEQVIIRLHCAA